MSINQIVNAEENPKIARLNDLIEQYNQTSSENNAIALLQKIEAMRVQIYSDKELRKSGNFMQWYFTDPIRNEINDKKLDQNRNLIFSAHSQSDIKYLTLQYWKMLTKPEMLGARSKSCGKMDALVLAVETATQNLFKAQGSQNEECLKLKDALEALQKQTLFMINNEVINSKSKTKKNFETLLNITNYLSKDLFNTYPELIRAPEQNYDPLVKALVAENRESRVELFHQLFRKQAPPQLNGFNVTYLGGGNNKNWLAINEETGSQFVLRLEPADDRIVDYSLVDEMKNDKVIKNNLAQDYFYCPVTLPQQGNNSKRYINVAVSEFCSDSNLHNYHLNTVANSPEKDKSCYLGTLDAIEQVAKIASDFNQKNMGYMDIKATNFLRKANGQLITADTKSVVRTDQDNRVPVNEISTHFEPPEFTLGTEPFVEAESYMVYQIGLMAYDLMLSTKEYNAQEIILDHLQKKESLNFNLPIFNTPIGKGIKELIEMTLDATPDSRPPLDVIIGKARALKVEYAEYCNEMEHKKEGNALSNAENENFGVIDLKKSCREFKAAYQEINGENDLEIHSPNMSMS
jgi:hypothetical protein